MSLAPFEQQILTDIETRLRRSDLKLAARLALFRRHASRGQGPARELLSPWRAPCRRQAVWIVLAAVLVAVLLILSIVLAGHGGQSHAAAMASAASLPPTARLSPPAPAWAGVTSSAHFASGFGQRCSHATGKGIIPVCRVSDDGWCLFDRGRPRGPAALRLGARPRRTRTTDCRARSVASSSAAAGSRPARRAPHGGDGRP
jgi:hypothetical protein